MSLETCYNLKQYVVSKDNFTDDLHYVKIPENHIVNDFDIIYNQALEDLESKIKEYCDNDVIATEVAFYQEGYCPVCGSKIYSEPSGWCGQE